MDMTAVLPSLPPLFPKCDGVAALVMTAWFVEAGDGTARNGSCGRLQNCKALRTEGQSVEIDLGLADFENLSIVTIR